MTATTPEKMNEQEKLEDYFRRRHMTVPATIDVITHPLEDTPPVVRFNPTERNQNDGLQRDYTELGGLVTGNDSPTREEFAAEVDIENILRRHGAAALLGINRGENIGGFDEAIDLQEAIFLQRRAAASFAVLPEKLRKMYPTIEALMHAVENGSIDLAEFDKPEPPLPSDDPTKTQEGAKPPEK